jgi:hypothetical protein
VRLNQIHGLGGTVLGAAGSKPAARYFPFSDRLSDLPASRTTLRRKSYCVWTSRSAIHGGVDNVLPPGRALAVCRQRLVDCVDELAYRLDRRALP